MSGLYYFDFLDKEVKNMGLSILGFKVGGFRNITAAELYLNDVTAIVGINGYGKSNVVSAVDFGIEFITSPTAFKRSYMSMKGEIPLIRQNAGMDYSFSIEAKYQEFTLDYGFSFAWETIHSKSGIKEEYLNIKSEAGTNHYSNFIKRDGKDAKYKASQKGRCSTKITVDDDELVINKLIHNETLFYHEIISVINGLRFCIEKYMDADRPFIPQPFIIKSSHEIKNISDIPRIVWQIREKHKEKYDILIDSFKHIFPSIKEITCMEHNITAENTADPEDDSGIMFSDSIYTMRVKDERLTQAISFKRLSDGTKRVFIALTFAVLADINNLSVIVYEEPENSVHPALLQTYLRVLDKLSGECKIIYTSHSPYIIQYMPADSIYIGLKHRSGIADFRKITKPDMLLNQANKNGQTIGDLIFNYLSFENSTEMLKNYISSSVVNDIDEEDDNDWLDDIDTNNVSTDDQE